MHVRDEVEGHPKRESPKLERLVSPHPVHCFKFGLIVGVRRFGVNVRLEKNCVESHASEKHAHDESEDG